MLRSLRAIVLTAGAGACLCVMAGCPPPVIRDFRATPRIACPNSLVALQWDVDADSIGLGSDVPTGETLPGDLPPGGPGAGFRFRVGATNTTFTLTARRGTNTPATSVVTVIVPPPPYTEGFSIPYNCGSRMWSARIMGPASAPPEAFISSITNEESFPVYVQTQALVHGTGPMRFEPHEMKAVPAYFPLTGSEWVAYPADPSPRPDCPPARTGSEPPPPPLPDPIRLSVSLTCTPSP